MPSSVPRYRPAGRLLGAVGRIVVLSPLYVATVVLVAGLVSAPAGAVSGQPMLKRMEDGRCLGRVGDAARYVVCGDSAVFTAIDVDVDSFAIGLPGDGCLGAAGDVPVFVPCERAARFVLVPVKDAAFRLKVVGERRCLGGADGLPRYGDCPRASVFMTAGVRRP
ncbi:hypothetical protein [Allokutzneria albata]|uniref:Uncharacterized protein n=1 Tax=Allokutzneria albata TaxID=211114 RepID=A0A1G9TR89_ALLAB|nr:hypothetical protein [Allokutzneria albata]SDM50141.1 hypothetical protein SAMN04489726_1943 [Allokutzneria albata]